MTKEDNGFLTNLYNSLGAILKSNSPDETPSTILKAVDVEQRLCTEIVFKPLVKDAHGEWYTSETIKVGEESYSRNKDAIPSNLFHSKDTEMFSVRKSWVLEEDTVFDDSDAVVSKGTWLVETHYKDDALWEMKKSKELGGLSPKFYANVNTDTGEITDVFFSYKEFKDSMDNNGEVT